MGAKRHDHQFNLIAGWRKSGAMDAGGGAAEPFGRPVSPMVTYGSRA